MSLCECRGKCLVTCYSSNLLHEKVDVQLGVIHDKTMRVSDPLQGFIHRLTVDVDPACSSGSQEVSETRTHTHKFVAMLTRLGILPMCESAYFCQCARPRTLHVLIDLLHLFHNLGTFSMSNILTGLPETQVLRWRRYRTFRSGFFF